MAKFQLNEFAEEVQKEYQQKVADALRRAERILDKKIQDIIQTMMIDDYYDGHSPRVYERTFQLPKSVAPYIGIDNIGGTFGITIGVDDEEPYGPSAMNHIRICKKRKRKAKENANREKIIFEYFLSGIHPRVGRANTHHIEEEVNKALDDLFDKELSDIVLKELAKIK